MEGEGDRVDEGGEEKEPARGGGDRVEAEAEQPRLTIFILMIGLAGRAEYVIINSFNPLR